VCQHKREVCNIYKLKDYFDLSYSQGYFSLQRDEKKWILGIHITIPIWIKSIHYVLRSLGLEAGNDI